MPLVQTVRKVGWKGFDFAAEEGGRATRDCLRDPPCDTLCQYRPWRSADRDSAESKPNNPVPGTLCTAKLAGCL
eukprot:1177994-Rhodomonas_salina.2